MEWIKCSDDLPEEYTEILFVIFQDEFSAVRSGYFTDDNYFYSHPDDDLFDIKCITHWMPLPEPPKGK
ncbi:DUF551 domain-containing protein [Xenorhabdus sp. BG5]|uniref:DUF551 domain-containing protein n=1 Tax=Xenorhabdus sp. BG5 TaxID=2782014 RepID=UPI001880CD76|nr:DUF551 domain-containing protein [Xenorhabdus sp. BG5]MBE8598089.1 DUF551 domain-containing protein [Xenorhabdus sp. BG5]